MSTYVKEKVLRIPIEYTGIVADEDVLEAFEQSAREAGKWGHGDVGKFQFAPTESIFVDFVLDYEYDSFGDFGKVRELYPSEVEKWSPIFKEIMPECDVSKVKLVEFCWYNCCEAPDYYGQSAETDPFFEEV